MREIMRDFLAGLTWAIGYALGSALAERVKNGPEKKPCACCKGSGQRIPGPCNP